MNRPDEQTVNWAQDSLNVQAQRVVISGIEVWLWPAASSAPQKKTE